MPPVNNRQNPLLQSESLQRLQLDPKAIRVALIKDDEDIHP